MSAYALPDGNVLVALSGGRTSAFMLHELLRVNGPLPDRVIVSFQNTGRESPETLDFVHEIGERWGVNIVWLEYRPDAPRFAVVDYASASRDGAPFEALIRKRQLLPNQRARFCTAELKVHASSRYLRSIGWARWTSCLGIRADESRRLNKAPPRERWSPWYPLAEAGVTKHHVTEFWAAQPFDLGLRNENGKTPDGNCKGCFLKSERYLANLVIEDPAEHAWWERMEAIGATFGKGDAGRFSKRYSRRQMRDFIESQGTLALSLEGALCQADDGECFA